MRGEKLAAGVSCGAIILGWLVGVFAGDVPPAAADEWPQWRGPEGNNHANPGARLPRQWDLDRGQNVVWKTAIPGEGHSTPIVIPEGIFLTTSDREAGTQSLVKLDRRTGEVLDTWVIHRGKLPSRIHAKNTHASPSAAYDGKRVIVTFHHDDAIWATAMTPEGQRVWQRRVASFEPSAFQFGYGASPIVEGDLVIVAAEYDGEQSGLYALESRSGRPVWKIFRPSNLNFASPIVATIAGQRQVLLAGANTISAYQPLNGSELWSVDASTEAICGTVVWDGRRVMVSGGNPDAGTWCVRATGEKQLLWDNNVMCYEQSLLTIDDHVFAVADNGVAYCWRTVDGKEMWKARLCRGGISSSPLLVGDEIVVASEAGEVFTLAATPSRFKLLAENRAGDRIFASPVVVDDRLYLRTTVGAGNRDATLLVAIGLE